MSSKLKLAVFGVGSLGKEHARLYAQLAAGGLIEFAGVYDPAPDAAGRAREKLSVRVFTSPEEAMQAADAFSIVTPTATHFALAKALLEQHKHVLVEKPMTDDAAQAAELVRLAQQNDCVLQVGHIERFNPVFKYLESVATEPRFIETHRLSRFPARSTDVGVVLDLMIHDLDIVLAFVKSPVESVDAVGIPVLSKSEDVANARLRFQNGCVANLTVSRIAPERMRKNPRVQLRAGAELRVARLPRARGLHLPHRARRRGVLVAAEEAAAEQGFEHRQRICGPANRARAGAHREGGAAEIGVAGFCPMCDPASDAEGQRRIGAAGAGSGVRDHAANWEEMIFQFSSYPLNPLNHGLHGWHGLGVIIRAFRVIRGQKIFCLWAA